MTLPRNPNRNLPTLQKVALLAVASIFAFLNVLSIETAVAAVSNKVFVFYGKIQAVDAAARTFSLGTDKGTYVFGVTDQTTIIRKKRPVKFEGIKAGEETEVDMKIGPGGKGVAVSINLGPFPSLYSPVQSLFAATTPTGKRVAGLEVSRLIDYQPVLEPINRAIDFGPLRMGVFLLSVRPDGTVANVEMLNSIGHSELNERTTKWLLKWRFQPNSVAQVKVPATFTKRYQY